MIKLCIFDLDGTILNTLTQIEYYVNHAMNKEGLPSVPRDKIRQFVGYGARNLLGKCLAHVGKEYGEEFFERFFTEYLEKYNSDAYYLAEPFEGIIDALKYARGQGITLAILSNKPQSTLTPTAEHFFGGLFDIVMGGSDKYPLKPSPDAARAILEMAGATPEQTLFVGDGETDMECASRLGATAAGALWGFRDRDILLANGADILLEKPTDIIDAIKERAK